MGFLFIAIYFVIIFIVLEIAVVLLLLTGLDKEIARFQVVSMLTGTGFTTKESELILRHPIRRKIGVFLILFGGFSLAVIISSLSALLAESFRIVQLASVMLVLGFVLSVVRSRAFSRRSTKWMKKEMKEDFQLHELPIQEIMYLDENDLVTSIPIHEQSKHANRKMNDLFDKEKDILLLFIQRGSLKMRSGIAKETVRVGDILYVYGSRRDIENEFGDELEKTNEEVRDEDQIASLQ